MYFGSMSETEERKRSMQHRDYFEKEVRTVLCVRDLERSRNFYQQTLELVPAEWRAAALLQQAVQ